MGVQTRTISTGQYKLFATDGSAAAPSITFAGDLDTGFYKAGANNVTFIANGASAGFFDGTNGLCGVGGGTLGKIAGSATVPSIKTNYADANTGLGTEGADILNLITGGTTKAKITSDGAVILIGIATASAPAYVEGGIYYDTTLHKLRVGGAAGWETITSV